jgi:hypothetical protein
MTLIPHTYEWFEELRRHNPKQAEHTAKLVELFGRDDICSLRGNDESKTFRMVSDPAMTLRLCEPCRYLQKQMYGLSVDQLD